MRHIYDTAARRRVLGRIRCRLGGRPLLHRLRPAAARRDDRALRGQARRHARRGRVLAGGVRARGEGVVHRADGDPGDQEGRPRRHCTWPSTTCRRCSTCSRPASGSTPAPTTGRRSKLGIPVVDHWWQTETGWAIAANPMGVEPLPIKPGSATVPMPGYDVRILRPDGTECDAGEEGAICVRLPLPPGTLPTLWGDDDRYVAVVPVGVPRLLPHRRRRLPRRGRLPVRHGPHRRRDQRCGTPAVDGVDRGGAGRPSRGRRVRGDRRRRRDQGSGAARLRRAQGGRDRPRGSPRNWSRRCATTSARWRASRRVDVVAALPKTRSGKILRKTMRGIADGRDEPRAVDHRGPGGARRAETDSAG